MIEQQGKVIAERPGRISVRLGGTSGCTACDAGKGCGAGVFGRLLQRKPVVMKFDNTLQALEGQAVMVGLPESLFLSLALRFYLYPVLSAIAGAAAGHVVAHYLGATALVMDAAALLAGLAAAYLAVRRIRSAAMEFPGRNTVHLLRIIESTSCTTKNEVYQ